ncbi:MAG: hypothetical protein H7240_07495 [Glaciimonas sp.]|nr:hypothetical protein [Glaciimonas sp.]
MLAASTYTGIDKKTKDWRIPTKNDMEQVGKCLNKNARIWTSERAVTDDGAIVYENGLYYENSAKDEIHNLGMFVRGGNETSQKQFVAMIKNKIEPDIRRELAEVEKFYADRAIARQESEKLADAREREKLRREMKVIEESPKGTTINCTTNDVVPVNISINQIVFNCPLLGDARTDFLQKYRWKVTSTERIKVQTGTYNMDSYGTRNWNGNGVVISIMLEKF